MRGINRSGGMVGQVDGGGLLNLSRCWNEGKIVIRSTGIGGGLVGWYLSTSGNGSVITDCYNKGEVVNDSSEASGVSGIAGQFLFGHDHVRIMNCYNVGIMSGDGVKSSITTVNESSQLSNCFYYSEDGHDNTAPYDGAQMLTETQLKSWALAYALNGQNMDGPWKYTEGEYPGFGSLKRPDSWQVVGQGGLDGLVKAGVLGEEDGSLSAPYKLGTPEQLAAFMVKVNTDNPDICGILLKDINLIGERYGGSMTSPIPWEPIGTAASIYKGTLDGNGKVIGGMSVVKDGHAGLFGCAGGGAVIKGLGLYSNCSVTSSGITDSGGVAAFVGTVKSDGTSNTQITIQNCYNRGSVTGTTGRTGAFIGHFEGTVGGGGQKISNCYTTGHITAESGTPGVIAGTFTNGGGGTIDYCYWNINTSGSPSLTAVGSGNGGTVKECAGMTTADMSTVTAESSGGLLEKLNTGVGGGGWQRSAERNDGYPIYTVSKVKVNWADIGAVATAPSCSKPSSPETAGTLANPYSIWTAEDLAWFAYQVNSGNPALCAELKADINLFGGLYTGFDYDLGDADITSKALPWICIGSEDSGICYTGTFNGNGHTVSRMMTKDGEKLGLFGVLGDGAKISGLTVADSRLDASGLGYIGGIAGFISGNNVIVSFCGITGSLAGNGANFGGIVGGTESSSSLVIEGCYNAKDAEVTADTGTGSSTGGILGKSSSSNEVTIRNCYNQGSVKGYGNVGGIVGETVTGKIRITGCYNAGPVESSGVKCSIAGTGDVAGALITDCLVDKNCYYGTVNGIAVESAALGTWGAAWRLNGSSFRQLTGNSWTYVAGNSYPVLDTGMLTSAESWEAVGEALEYGLIKDMETPSGDGNTDPYEITTAEQLAWFAYQVNVAGKSGVKAVLVRDIDMKTTESHYQPAGRLSWMPIGKDGALAYIGTFVSQNLSDTADTRRIYQIQNLYVNTTGTAGLFGTAAGATVSRVGVANAVITGNNAGGIVGNASGATTIAQCYNRSENSESGDGKGSVTAGGNAGGIVGQTTAGVTVRDCYNLKTVIAGTGASSRAGGIVGSGEAGTIRNSYNACGLTGSITVSGTGMAGAVNGNPGTGSGMNRCYSDTGWKGGLVSMADSNFVSQLSSTGNTQIKEQTTGLNTVGDKVNTLEDRIWYTSLTAEATKGYPTLEPPVMINAGEAVPVDDADGAAGVLLNFGVTGSIVDAKFRYASQETASSELVILTEWKTEYYNSFGTTSANGKVGLSGAAGSTETMLDPAKMSLENPSQSLGTISSLKLYTGAAYTYPTSRDMLVELSSNTTRYEIRFTIKGVTGKSLIVDLPADVTMEELLPGGAEDTAYSVSDVAMKNSHAYPMEANIVKVTPISETDRTGYRALKPIAKNVSYAGGQIYDSGVKLGITNPKTGTGVIGEDLYYNPDAAGDANPWMKCQLKAGGTLSYRYFLKYQSDPYYDSGHPNFGFTISYQFRVMADDYSASTDAVVFQ